MTMSLATPPGAADARTRDPQRAVKSAKIIALLEEFFCRNDPNQGDHRDKMAEALAEPADPQIVLDAILAAERAEDRG